MGERGCGPTGLPVTAISRHRPADALDDAYAPFVLPLTGWVCGFGRGVLVGSDWQRVREVLCGLLAGSSVVDEGDACEGEEGEGEGGGFGDRGGGDLEVSGAGGCVETGDQELTAAGAGEVQLIKDLRAAAVPESERAQGVVQPGIAIAGGVDQPGSRGGLLRVEQHHARRLGVDLLAVFEEDVGRDDAPFARLDRGEGRRQNATPFLQPQMHGGGEEVIRDIVRANGAGGDQGGITHSRELPRGIGEAASPQAARDGRGSPVKDVAEECRDILGCQAPGSAPGARRQDPRHRRRGDDAGEYETKPREQAAERTEFHGESFLADWVGKNS